MKYTQKKNLTSALALLLFSLNLTSHTNLQAFTVRSQTFKNQLLLLAAIINQLLFDMSDSRARSPPTRSLFTQLYLAFQNHGNISLL